MGPEIPNIRKNTGTEVWRDGLWTMPRRRSGENPSEDKRKELTSQGNTIKERLVALGGNCKIDCLLCRKKTVGTKAKDVLPNIHRT